MVSQQNFVKYNTKILIVISFYFPGFADLLVKWQKISDDLPYMTPCLKSLIRLYHQCSWILQATLEKNIPLIDVILIGR